MVVEVNGKLRDRLSVPPRTGRGRSSAPCPRKSQGCFCDGWPASCPRYLSLLIGSLNLVLGIGRASVPLPAGVFQRIDTFSDTREKRTYLRVKSRQHRERVAIRVFLLLARLCRAVGNSGRGLGIGVGNDLSRPFLRLAHNPRLGQTPFSLALGGLDDACGFLFSFRQRLRAPL